MGDQVKLGLHINHWTEAACETVRQARPPILKVLEADPEPLRKYKQLRPDGIVVVRRWFPNEDLKAVQRSEELLRFVEPIRAYVDWVETPWNESHQRDLELDAYAEATMLAVIRLRQHGYRTAIGNFSVGNPTVGGLHRFVAPFVDQPNVALSLHEYSAPRMQDGSPWYCLRYRFLRDAFPTMNLLITECGIDRGVLGEQLSGWRTATSVADYVAQLRWYDAQLQHDPQVLGATIFCCGTDDPAWDSFDVAGEQQIIDLLREDAVQFNIGAGFRAWAVREPEVIGSFIENETYHRFGTEQEVSFAWTTKGLLSWVRRTNQMVFQSNQGQTRIYNGGNPRWA